MKFTFAPEARPLDGYTIKRAIHRGGFGEVYYALSDAGKEVALKLLNNNLEVELRGVRQCLNLKHPNLVTIFDIREDSDHDHWVVMEYVSGRGLYETLQDFPGGMPVEDVLFWLDGISAGLSFLHDRGIVHRDLKPANVFRDHHTIKIGDVGLSKYISESRRSAQTQSVGTVYYMAPEVARGRYGREVDVYAFGIMLYEMLTGRVPFEGQTTAEILMKHLTAEPDLTVLPATLQPIVAAALTKDPDERISDVLELQREFRSAIAGADLSAPVPLTASTAGIDHQPQPRQTGSPYERVESATADGDRSRLEADTVIDIGTKPTATEAVSSTNDGNSTFGTVAEFWNALPAPLQWIIGGSAALLILESGLLRPVAVGGMIGGCAYLGYQVVNMFAGNTTEHRAGRRGKTPRSSNAAAAAPPPPKPPVAQASQRTSTGHHGAGRRVVQLTPATSRRLTKQQRMTDLWTSLSMSLVAATLVTVAVYLTTNLLRTPPQAIYFGSITLVAAWALIVPSKLWEGRPGDNFTRRLALGGIGLGVGFVASTMAHYLLIDQETLFQGKSGSSPVMIGRVLVSDGSSYPTLACFMIFFAALFILRKWWWQADSFRKARFRVSSALFTLVVGIVITGMLQDYAFPDALGATWALAISAVVQLASGWTPTEDRPGVLRAAQPNETAQNSTRPTASATVSQA